MFISSIHNYLLPLLELFDELFDELEDLDELLPDELDDEPEDLLTDDLEELPLLDLADGELFLEELLDGEE